MIHDLDHEAAIDPARVGAKAAWLAMARRAGLPVLPGLVVDAADSNGHMRLGAEKLATRGSGGARLALTAESVPFRDELVERGALLGDVLVARSSTVLESSGQWSGAFTSYLDLSPGDLPRAVTGCWASAFSVAALERQQAAGIEPGSFPMAVLIQPALDPVAGGTARVEDDGTVVVIGVKGSPAPLLQGWSNGHVAFLPPASEASISPPGERSERWRESPGEGRGVLAGSTAEDGKGGLWAGDVLVDLLGLETLDEIAHAMKEARDSVGANRGEWALDGRVRLLQLSEDTRPGRDLVAHSFQADPGLVPIARVVMRAGVGLGEELVLPWALGGLPAPVLAPDVAAARFSDNAMALALDLRDTLTAEVWGMPAEEALATAQRCMKTLLGPAPLSALEVIGGLRPPDPDRAGSLIALVEALEGDRPGPRRGVGRWEPFVASVVLSAGTRHPGTPAAPGIGAGISARIDHPDQVAPFRRRDVVVGRQPIPNLAPLLWVAAGIVTETGSPAAHLFESARALRVPAVCGVTIPPGDQIVAVDGHNGVVSTLPIHRDDDV